jgi:hypothetical protein
VTLHHNKWIEGSMFQESEKDQPSVQWISKVVIHFIKRRMHRICQEEPTHDMALIFHSFKMVLEKNEGRFLFLFLSLSLW